MIENQLPKIVIVVFWLFLIIPDSFFANQEIDVTYELTKVYIKSLYRYLSAKVFLS